MEISVDTPRTFKAWVGRSATFQNIVVTCAIFVTIGFYVQDTRTFNRSINERVSLLEQQRKLDHDAIEAVYRKMDSLQVQLDSVSRELQFARDDIREVRRAQK